VSRHTHRVTSVSAFPARLLALVALVLGMGWARDGLAYPWMIRHEYTACAQCHMDPSGGGPLSAYGRGMGEVLLRTQYGSSATEEAGEPGPAAKFLWGAVPLPEALDFGGSFRAAQMTQKIGDTPVEGRILYMQADLSAALHVGRWVAAGSMGYLPKGGLLASVSRGTTDNFVSRYHWVGYRLDEDGAMLLRAGRMNLPFGIRDILHTLTIRSATRTNIDDAQQHGVAFAYSGGSFRAEVMAILGNYQIRPDAFRERGATGYLEWAPDTHVAVGVSARVAHVDLDSHAFVPMWRHADGVFARWATPWRPLVLLTEADYVVDSPKEVPRYQGVQAMAQADVEVVQGLHYQLTGEAGDFGAHGSGAALSLWGSCAWFFASHMDVRLDAIFQSIPSPVGAVGAELLLGQLHLYL
jgi:hypothetical protein